MYTVPVCKRAWLVVLLVAASAAQPVHADQATLNAAADNTMYSEDATRSNGDGDYFFAGRTNAADLRRALIRFDIAAALPSGATVDSVALLLHRSRGKNGNYAMSLHRLLADWGEAGSDADAEEGQGAPAENGDATWSHRLYPDSMWTNAGGDYDATASATIIVGNDNVFYTWTTSTMIADVQGWLDTPSSNHGWLLIGVEASNRTARRFDSRTHPTPANWPQLRVWFTPQETVGACCLPDDSCELLTAADCAAQSGTYQGDGTPCNPDPCTVPVGACCFADGTCDELSAADCMNQGGTYQGDLTQCAPGLCPIELEPFVDALPVPAPLAPTSGTQGGEATYDIAMTEFLQQLHRDLPPTRVWGYGGATPGPLVEAFRDEPVTVNWINDLRDSLGVLRTTHYLPVDTCMHGPDTEGVTPRTVVHLHGGHVPAEVDGYPEDTFLPGEQVMYVYPNNQQAGPLWFHDHALGITRLNVQMGLAGLWMLRDSVETSLTLPDGASEIPLVIQDRSLNPDGSLAYPESWEGHFFGDFVMVNGKIWPYLEVLRGKYRFLVLDGSNSRVYDLALSNGATFEVIGNDGGFLDEPETVSHLLVTPGERYTVVMDFESYAPGTEIELVNSAPAPYPGTPGVGVVEDVMKFVVIGGGTPFTDALPTSLASVEDLPESTAVETRDLFLRKGPEGCAGEIWTINGLHWDDITEYPIVGTTEIWRFINDTGVVHPMHMHLSFFRILDRTPVTVDGDSVIVTGPATPPGEWEAGWKDTAPVGPGEMLRVIVRFDDYLGKYAYHCHILEHEDHEMMRQFKVISPVSVTSNLGLPALGLLPPRPNPFGTKTSLVFDLPGGGDVVVRVLDVTGRLVSILANERFEPGRHTIVWDTSAPAGSQLPSGVYFVELSAGERRSVRKVAVVR